MRLASACDRCKARKVRCDGLQPCSHCKRRKNERCYYSHASSSLRQRLPSSDSPAVHTVHQHARPAPPLSSSVTDDDDTVVPRDSRLLQDAQGKLMFIGDSAPLSFLQSVRLLFSTSINRESFATNSSCDALLEQTDASIIPDPNLSRTLLSNVSISVVVASFCEATCGLIAIGRPSEIEEQIRYWLSCSTLEDIMSAVNYLIFAIGLQSSHDDLSAQCFHKARTITLAHLTLDTSPLTVQAFLLIAVYMLRNSQPNGAFLYFGLAARASYSIGMHRTEVNNKFGLGLKRQRERLYKSLKVFDLFISVLLGRPPALYDLDCTVEYVNASCNEAVEVMDILDDVVRIQLVLENIVVEVYGGQRKISLQLTRTISRRLKEWADRCMPRLNRVIAAQGQTCETTAACHALSTYFYSVMALSKPFLMFEAYRALEGRDDAMSKSGASTGRRVLADGCIDAACCLVEMVLGLTRSARIPQKLPIIVSWTFSAALTLGVALVSGFGRITERYLRDAIEALMYFARNDAQAMQYSAVAQSLLSACLDHIQSKELHDRLARVKASSDLFGLHVGTYRQTSPTVSKVQGDVDTEPATDTAVLQHGFTTPDWEDFDLSVFGDFAETTNQDIFGTLNLFPTHENIG